MEAIYVVSNFLLWIMVLLNLGLTLGLAQRLRTTNPERLKPGQKAPDFSALRLDGQVTRLADFIGVTFVMIFFSPDCATCSEVLVGIKELKASAQLENVKLILVGDHEPESLLEYMSGMELEGTILSAPRKKNSLLIDYKVLGVPSFCIVDKTGIVKVSDFGTTEDIKRALID